MRPFGFMLAAEPPPKRVGVLAAIGAVAVCTLLLYPLKQIAPVVSLGVVYLLAVLVVSAVWGAWLGVLTAVLSAGAFNFFHLPPTGRFTISSSENWVALIAFLVAAGLASSIAEVTRARAREAEERRREADLAAEMARLLLRGNNLAQALPTAAARLAQVLGLHSAAIEMDTVEGDERRIAFPLREGTRRLGTLLVGADTPEASLRRLQERVVPALEALLSAALERDALLGEVVETASLRRADVVKTAVLRAVSHDLRSPLTAISAAGEARCARRACLRHEREELAAVIEQETRRLSRLVENLLDLSRLEAGAAEPQPEWMSVEEVMGAALAELGARPGVQRSRSTAICRWCAQIRAAGARVRERARERPPALGRASGVGARAGGAERRGRAGRRVIVRSSTAGPAYPRRSWSACSSPSTVPDASGGHRGSGLGLAIARGFVQANGGKLHVESLPGQGATFVFELPLARGEPRPRTSSDAACGLA